jgi:hypothetical protein
MHAGECFLNHPLYPSEQPASACLLGGSHDVISSQRPGNLSTLQPLGFSVQVNAAEAHIKLLEARLSEHANPLAVPTRANHMTIPSRAATVQVPAEVPCQNKLRPAQPLYREMLATLQHQQGRCTESMYERAVGTTSAPARQNIVDRAAVQHGLNDCGMATFLTNQDALDYHQRRDGHRTNGEIGRVAGTSQPDGHRIFSSSRQPMAELSSNQSMHFDADAVNSRARAHGLFAVGGAVPARLQGTKSPISGNVLARSATDGQWTSGRLSAMERMQRLHEKLKQREKDVSERMQRIIGYGGNIA